jgi:hypothetical protein
MKKEFPFHLTSSFQTRKGSGDDVAVLLTGARMCWNALKKQEDQGLYHHNLSIRHIMVDKGMTSISILNYFYNYSMI